MFALVYSGEELQHSDLELSGICYLEWTNQDTCQGRISELVISQQKTHLRMIRK